MNYVRIVIAAVVATLVDAVYGFLVYGNLLTSEFAKYPDIYRPSDLQTAYLPGMFVGLLFAMIIATMIYAKGYEGGSGLAEGLRFGFLVGLLMIGYVAGVQYATMRIGKRLAGYYAISGLVEWTLVGAAIGLVYRTTAGAQGATKRAAAGV